MTRRVIGITWVCAVLALFLVALAPACSFGAKTRAASARFFGTPPVSSSPDEDEREHGPAEVRTARLDGAPSTTPVQPVMPRPPRSLAQTFAARHRAPRISRGVPPWRHHARFSERRLI
ncbi:MAG TPA: hypothetical protein VGC42_08455 [Kofleriaceae bacterium]